MALARGILSLSIFLALAGNSFHALGGEALFPQRLDRLPLTDAEMWAGDEQLDIEIADEHRAGGGRFWGRWNVAEYPAPRFFVCRYGTDENGNMRPKLVVPVPDGAASCEIDVRRKDRARYLWDVKMAGCSGSGIAAASRYPTSAPDRSTELEGFSLSMTRAALIASARARNGNLVADDGSVLRLQMGEKEIVARFPTDTDVPREIVALLPPRQGHSHDVYWSLVLRFGTQTQAMAFPEYQWHGRDDVWVVYNPGRREGVDPQQLRLVDSSRQTSR